MLRLAALGIHELSWRRGLYHYVAVFATDALDHDHRIRSARQKPAGHDLHSFSCPHLGTGALSGSHFTSDAQAAWSIGGAHGESVPNRFRRGRPIAIGVYVVCKHPVASTRQYDGFGFWKYTQGSYFLEDARSGFTKVQDCHEANSSNCSDGYSAA